MSRSPTSDQRPNEEPAWDWVRTQDPERDKNETVLLIMEAIGAKEGMRIADVGAGAGYYTFKLAEVVGPTGMVIATEADPKMAEHLERERSRRRAENVQALEVQYEYLKLSRASVDLILMVDLYLFKRRPWAGKMGAGFNRFYLEQCHKALRASGRLVLAQHKVRPAHGPCDPASPHFCADADADEIIALAGGLFELERRVPIGRPRGDDSAGFLLVFGRK